MSIAGTEAVGDAEEEEGRCAAAVEVFVLVAGGTWMRRGEGWEEATPVEGPAG